MSKSLKKIWKNKEAILEGIKNNIFKKENIEVIAKERNKICKACDFLDTTGDNCAVPLTSPCCALCGCSLKFKLRSLSSECPEGKWEAVLTDDEADKLDLLNPDSDD